MAALLVVFDHYFESVAFQPVPPALLDTIRFATLDAFSSGRVGVVAFFCISGFVIPFSFKGHTPLRHFVISRFFRLYPAYWLALALAVFLFPLIGRSYAPTTIAANASMLTKFLGQPYILGVAWTLTVELIFYGICFVNQTVGRLHSAKFYLLALLVFCGLAVAMGYHRFAHPSSGLPAGIATFLGIMHFGALIRLWRLEGDPAAASLSRVALIAMPIMVSAANTLGYLHGGDNGSGPHITTLAISTGYFAGVALFLGCVWRRWFTSAILCS